MCGFYEQASTSTIEPGQAYARETPPELDERQKRLMGLIEDDITDFILAFEGNKLVKEDWTHDTHIMIGLYYAWLHQSIPVAVRKMREGVLAFNEKVGNSTGYHATLTSAFITLLDQVVRLSGKEEPLQNILARVQESVLAEKHVLFKFYSKELLLSDTARTNVVKPDLVGPPVLNLLNMKRLRVKVEPVEVTQKRIEARVIEAPPKPVEVRVLLTA